MAKKPRPKQLTIAGTKGVVIKELDQAATAYVEVRDERMELTEREVEARGRLVVLMRKHAQTVYRVDAEPPMVVTLSEDVKVSVRKVKEREADTE